MTDKSQNTEPSFTLAQSGAPERIAKRIARAGVCSRREAEALILAGRVRLNGEILTQRHVLSLPRTELRLMVRLARS